MATAPAICRNRFPSWQWLQRFVGTDYHHGNGSSDLSEGISIMAMAPAICRKEFTDRKYHQRFVASHLQTVNIASDLSEAIYIL
jgi:hypothetical protein